MTTTAMAYLKNFGFLGLSHFAAHMLHSTDFTINMLPVLILS